MKYREMVKERYMEQNLENETYNWHGSTQKNITAIINELQNDWLNRNAYMHNKCKKKKK